MIIRVANRTRYSIIRTESLEDTSLTFKARGVLAYLLSKPDAWEISERHLATQSPDGVTAIRSALKELESSGYLHRERSRDNNGRWNWETVLYESPRNETDAPPQSVEKQAPPCLGFPRMDNPYTVKPSTDNPRMVKPSTGNLSITNKEVSNTEVSNIEGVNIEGVETSIPPPQNVAIPDVPADTKAKAKTKAPAASYLPESFSADPELIEWANEHHRSLNTQTETQKFIDYWLASSSPTAKKRDWRAAWRTWITRAAGYAADRRTERRDNQFATSAPLPRRSGHTTTEQARANVARTVNQLLTEGDGFD